LAALWLHAVFLIGPMPAIRDKQSVAVQTVERGFSGHRPPASNPLFPALQSRRRKTSEGKKIRAGRRGFFLKLLKKIDPKKTSVFKPPIPRGFQLAAHKYRTLHSNHHANLDKEVTELLKQGWELHGQPYKSPVNSLEVCQAMINPERPTAGYSLPDLPS
jgi:hypothetical protein